MSAVTTTPTPMTVDEFFEFVHRPENRDRILELERGEVVEMSRPSVLHGYVCNNIGRILGNFTFERRKGYVCSNDTGLVVERNPATVRGPDLMYFENADRLEDLARGFSEAPPQLSVEVISPTDTPSRLNQRIRQQLKCGVSVVWLVDPELRCVTTYWAGTGRKVEEITLEENEELTGEPALPGFRCRVGDFFAFPGR